MPIMVELLDASATAAMIDQVFTWFEQVDQTFSTYKPTSEISRINDGSLTIDAASPEVQKIFQLAAETKQQTHGYFDITDQGKVDPSGIVKGWAIERATDILRQGKQYNFYVSAGGDIAVSGVSSSGKPWRIGIRNPFNREENLKILSVSNCGVATSGTYIRGQHIYNPLTRRPANDIASLTVIGPNIYDADRFATAAYAMGQSGIQFVETLPGYEGYMIDHHGHATMTKGFDQFLLKP